MTDRYSRIMLTVIAASLVALVLQNATQTAVAQNPGLCGGAKNACWVQSAPSAPVYVTSHPKEGMYVTNLPFQPIEVKVAR